MKMNYSAIYVTLTSFFLLIAHAMAQSVVLGMLLVIVLPLLITISLFGYFEMHRYRNERVDEEFEDCEDDFDYVYHVSAVK